MLRNKTASFKCSIRRKQNYKDTPLDLIVKNVLFVRAVKSGGGGGVRTKRRPYRKNKRPQKQTAFAAGMFESTI